MVRWLSVFGLFPVAGGGREYTSRLIFVSAAAMPWCQEEIIQINSHKNRISKEDDFLLPAASTRKLGLLLVDLPNDFRAHCRATLRFLLEEEVIETVQMVLLVFRRDADSDFDRHRTAQNRRPIGLVRHAVDWHETSRLM